MKIFKSYPTRHGGKHRAGDKTPGERAKQTRLSYKGKGGSKLTGHKYTFKK